MPKKVILNESAVKKIIEEEYMEKKDIKNYVEKDRDFERRIKAIVANSINDLFRILWQRKNVYDSELKN